MTDNLTRAKTLIRAIFHEVKKERITFMAGTIAYNAFLSLLPLLFVLLSIASAIGGSNLEGSVLSLTEALVTPGTAEVFIGELRNTSSGASLVGIAALIWGLLRIFRSLDTAFSDIYETQVENTLSDQLIDSIVVFGTIAALLIGVFALDSIFGISDASGFLLVFQRFFLICVIALALTPMYYLFPDESGMSILEIVPGVLVTATGLVVLQSIFGYYVALSDPKANNQLLSSIVILLTWLYVCGLIILLGAAINAVLSNRSEDVNVEPLLGGVPKKQAGGLTGKQNDVPRELLEQLQHSFGEGRELRIVLDGDGEDIELPPPDIVTVNSDTSSLPVINDTASMELQWSEAGFKTESKE